jgi:hypothetical protein
MICFWWGIFNFALNYGDYAFAAHWGCWQDYLEIFNSKNPSGHVAGSDTNRRVLTLAVVISFVVAVKRFVVGLYLGRQTFSKQDPLISTFCFCSQHQLTMTISAYVC